MRSIPDAKQRRAEADLLRQKLAKLAGIGADLKRMDAIEATIKQAAPAATPKTREGFALLQRMIDDTRQLYRQAVPDPKDLTAPIE